MWQKVDDKYHWGLSADRFMAPDGQQVQTFCNMTIVVQRDNQIPYVTARHDRCDFCDGVSSIIHTAAYEAIRYSVKNETSVDVLRRALDFTNSVTLTKAINTRIRKLERVM